MITIVEVPVVVVVVVKVLVLIVGARADMVVINALDMEAIGCEFTVPVPCSHVGIDIFVDASLISGIVTDIGVGVLVDVNTNVLAGVMTALEFATSEPFEGFSC